VSALHVPLGWHARGDHAEVELDDDHSVHPLRSDRAERRERNER
jgi:hypothetical protein